MAADKFSMKEVACPACSSTFEIKVYDSVNFTSLPSARDDIFAQKFFTFVCPSCGKECSFLYPCLFHSVLKEYMIWFVPDGNADEVKIINNLYRGLDENAPYTAIGTFHEDLKYEKLRCVFTVSELREKVHIYDAGYDDRVMEIVKLLLCAQLTEEKKYNCTLTTPIYFSAEKEWNGEKQLEFSLLDGDELIAFCVEAGIYEKTATAFADKIPAPIKEFKVIDRAFALKALE